MTPEKLVHELLGLGPHWKVNECEFARESGVVTKRHFLETKPNPAKAAAKRGSAWKGLDLVVLVFLHKKIIRLFTI